MKKIVFLLIVHLFVLGCNDTTSSRSEDTSGKNIPTAQPPLELKTEIPVFKKISESLEGEMLPGVSIPTTLSIKRDAGVPPTGKDALFKMARKALDKGDVLEALAVIDVLVLTRQNDPEVFEMRGKILLQQGQKEDAKVDFDRCCSLGRPSCCP